MGKNRKLTSLPAAFFLCVFFSFAMTLTALAGQWKNGEDDPDSWWYDHLDGTWAVGWELIDGNGDGLGEWYLFDDDGWLITDYMTKEGYEVDYNGAWVVNGAVVHVRMDGSGTADGGTSGGGSSQSSGQGTSQASAEPPQ